MPLDRNSFSGPLSPREFLGVAETYKAELDALPASLRAEFAEQQERIASETDRFLDRYNRNIRSRIRGYLTIAEELEYAYPWPVVAVLGICQVLEGEWRAQFYGLIGTGLGRIGYRRLDYLADASSDILRRTNRGIFGDSMPAVRYALRCVQLRRAGQTELANALLTGPMPPTFDTQTAELVRSLASGLEVAPLPARFQTLRDLTIRHFDREQAVFSHHMGVDRNQRYNKAKGWVGLMTRFRRVPAPRIVRTPKPHLEFRPYKLPDDFDIRNHDTRVAAFSPAFVESVTQSIEDYRVAIDYLHQRFGAGTRPRCIYD